MTLIGGPTPPPTDNNTTSEAAAALSFPLAHSNSKPLSLRHPFLPPSHDQRRSSKVYVGKCCFGLVRFTSALHMWPDPYQLNLQLADDEIRSQCSPRVVYEPRRRATPTPHGPGVFWPSAFRKSSHFFINARLIFGMFLAGPPACLDAAQRNSNAR